MSTIHKKLVAIQSELKAPKSQVNKHFGYKYRSCEDVIEAVKPLAHAQNCAVTLSDEVVEICGRAYVRATASLSDGEGTVSVTGHAGEPAASNRMDASQCTGSASTYARKRALDGLFAIDDTKDADTMDNTKAEPKAVVKAEPKKKPTLEAISKYMDACTVPMEIENAYASAMKYAWTDAEALQINEIYKEALNRVLPI